MRTAAWIWLALVVLATAAIGCCGSGDAEAGKPLAQPACEWIEVEAQDIAEHYGSHVFECESSGMRCLLVLAHNSSSMECFRLEGE